MPDHIGPPVYHNLYKSERTNLVHTRQRVVNGNVINLVSDSIDNIIIY
jgi:signal transduction histidine kinase